MKTKEITTGTYEEFNTYEQFRELAGNNNLQFIETTSGRNGYPEHLRPGLIGFETYEQVEVFAKDRNLSVELFHRRDGWQLWERGGYITEALQVRVEYFGDDFNSYKPDKLDFFYEYEIAPVLDVFQNLDELKEFIKAQEEIMQELEKCEDDEIVITHLGKYYKTIKQKTMEFAHDTHHYAIGVTSYEE